MHCAATAVQTAPLRTAAEASAKCLCEQDRAAYWDQESRKVAEELELLFGTWSAGKKHKRGPSLIHIFICFTSEAS